jgi:hypothetical protein
MTQTFVVRLCDADRRMLSWARVEAESRPQRPKAGSCPFYAAQPTVFIIDRVGVATQLIVHWANLDVVRSVPMLTSVDVEPGQVHQFSWMEPVWLVPGERDIVLEGVTERSSVMIGVPTGGIGIVASR